MKPAECDVMLDIVSEGIAGSISAIPSSTRQICLAPSLDSSYAIDSPAIPPPTIKLWYLVVKVDPKCSYEPS